MTEWSFKPYSPDTKEAVLKRIAAGEKPYAIWKETNIAPRTIERWIRASKGTKPPVEKPSPPPAHHTSISKILYLDIETLPNMGLFFETYSDRAIPLDFILKPKAICTIAWKFSGDTEAKVLCVANPYDDKDILEQILPIFEHANYIVWHFGEGFDRKFLEGRLMANGLPSLPPVASVDTYKLAKNKFGKTLNSNRLDHLGETLGVGRKNKTNADLWVRCARGDLDAMQEMAAYNQQDVQLLEAVYLKLEPNVKTKVNQNLLFDDAVNRCKPCGSTNITLKGHELTAATFRHRYQCNDCGAWSTFPRKKSNEKPPEQKP